MFSDKKIEILKKEYAKLIVNFGLNSPKSDYVLIYSNVNNYDFLNLVIEECYKAKVKRVLVKYMNPVSNALAYKYGDEETLKKFLSFEEGELDFYTKNNTPRIYLFSEEFTNDIKYDLDKVNRILIAKSKINSKHLETLNSSANWTIAPIPSINWSKKLFPNLDEKLALKKAYELFFNVIRIEENKSISNWEKQNKILKDKCEKLNKLGIKEMNYESKNGTNFTVGLLDGSLFYGGTHTNSITKVRFNPNFPTEEVFTSPNRFKADGILYASKPLIYKEKLIDGICFKFKDGKIIEAKAKTNNKLLQGLLSIDEGARYLGEVALVPYDGLVNKSGKTFYSTIFDENCCCHFAFGQSFPFTYKNGNQLNQKELMKAGLNFSNTHIDFMIGTKDLLITAKCKNGKSVIIFKDGVWAI